MDIALSTFDKGLFLDVPPDALPEGYLLRARGMHLTARKSFRSRFGSSLIAALNAHSITYFNDIYHYGVGSALYRALISIKSGLSGDRISFSRMPPVAGVADYLFCCEGSDCWKVNSAGTVTDWGFAAPASNPGGAAVAGGSLTAGVYKYQITYYNSTTGHRSNGNGTDVEVTTAGGNLTARLSAIPDGSLIDPQIDYVEIWRSVIDGDLLFYLDRIATGTATYDDDGTTELSSEELPTDNLKPYDTFFECLGPHNASMFWLRDTTGTRGLVYYSPIGRAESVEGYINVCGNDSPLNKLFLFQGQLGVIGEAGIYIIGGTNPYIARQVSGVPGTTKPYTVKVIPNVGLMYEASDGIRLFNGSASDLISPDTTELAFKVKIPGSIERIFRGESAGDFTSFSGEIAEFARNEYIISDGTQSLAFDVTAKRWRDLGVGVDALFYNKETSDLAATVDGSVLAFEDESELTDNGTAIELSFEPRHIATEDEKKRILQFITFDINTASQQITATIICDDVTTTLGILQFASRTKITYPVGLEANRFGVRLTGSLSAAIEIHSISMTFNDLTTTQSGESK